jgi:hypothetical protein
MGIPVAALQQPIENKKGFVKYGEKRAVATGTGTETVLCAREGRKRQGTVGTN